MKKLLIFDVDGTLYQFPGGSFSNSPLKKLVRENVLLLIQKHLSVTAQKSLDIFNKIENKYGETLSIGFEKEFGINRNEYFNFVWNIPANLVLKKDPTLRPLFLNLQKSFTLLVLTDAPRTWILNVLNYLDIIDLFEDNIITGESNIRKEFGNAFENILKIKKIKPEDCLSIGDQEKTDIIPAKQLGIKTIYIKDTPSKEADFTIKDIQDLPPILEKELG